MYSVSCRAATEGTSMRIIQGFILLFALLVCQTAMATGQIPEQILIDGKPNILFSEPLQNLLKNPAQMEKLRPYLSNLLCTASWRGYMAYWEIRDGNLFLVQVLANPCDKEPQEVPLSAFFTGSSGPVMASWYSGNLLVPLGKRLEYIHMGYESRYEKYLVISIKNGKVVGRNEVSERPKDMP